MATNDERGSEPSLHELLADPVVRAVMKADGLDARDLVQLVESVSRNWRPATLKPQPTDSEAPKRRRASGA